MNTILKNNSVLAIAVIIVVVIASVVAGCQREEAEISDNSQKGIVTELWFQSLSEKLITSIIVITKDNKGNIYYEYVPYFKQISPRLKSGSELTGDWVSYKNCITALEMYEAMSALEKEMDGRPYQTTFVPDLDKNGRPTGSGTLLYRN